MSIARKSRRGRGGFTLIELVLVIAIIFAFSAIVAPRFSDFVPALRVQRTADDLLGTARKGRADAALHGLNYRLRIDTNEREYWLEVQGNPFQDADEWKTLPGLWGDRTKFPDGVEIDSEEDTLEFRPDGTATEGELRVYDQKDNEVVIKIEAATGRVYIEDEEQ